MVNSVPAYRQVVVIDRGKGIAHEAGYGPRVAASHLTREDAVRERQRTIGIIHRDETTVIVLMDASPGAAYLCCAAAIRDGTRAVAVGGKARGIAVGRLDLAGKVQVHDLGILQVAERCARVLSSHQVDIDGVTAAVERALETAHLAAARHRRHIDIAVQLYILALIRVALTDTFGKQVPVVAGADQVRTCLGA